MSDPLVKYFKRKNYSKIAFWVTSRAYIYSRFVIGMIMYVYQESFLEATLYHVHLAVPPNIVLVISIGILCWIRMLAGISGPPTCGFEFDPKPEEIFQLERMFWPEVRSSTFYTLQFISFYNTSNKLYFYFVQTNRSRNKIIEKGHL